jgi:hypothetical protein
MGVKLLNQGRLVREPTPSCLPIDGRLDLTEGVLGGCPKMPSPAQEEDGRRNGNGKRGQGGSGSPPDRLDVDGTTREGEVMLGVDVVNTPLRWINPGECRTPLQVDPSRREQDFFPLRCQWIGPGESRILPEFTYRPCMAWLSCHSQTPSADRVRGLERAPRGSPKGTHCWNLPWCCGLFPGPQWGLWPFN